MSKAASNQSSYLATGLSITALVVSLSVFLPNPLIAQTFTVLHTFTDQPDGRGPSASLTVGGDGNLYGTTASGGSHHLGTVFKIDSTGNETVIHDFVTEEGGAPLGQLLRDRNNNLYGTAESSGLNGAGSVFKIASDGTFTVVHRFTEGVRHDGQNPASSLISDSNGNLYGTTQYGGLYGVGTIFKLDPSGNETILLDFSGSDGAYPISWLLRDPLGNFYGTTSAGGGMGYGSVYKMDATGLPSVLYAFHGQKDGSVPSAGVVLGSGGVMYGTAASYCGSIFSVTPSGRFKRLHMFTGSDGCLVYSGVIQDAGGNLYGTTSAGGDFDSGTVYKLDPHTGALTVLYSFTGGADGEAPQGGVVMDHAGNLYGTTGYGGDSCNCGVVFKLTP